MALALVKPSLQELRTLIGAVEKIEKPTSTFSLYKDGLPKGVVIEVVGYGKTEFIARFLKEQPSYKVAWVEKEITINPYALFQKGVRTENILFVEAPNHLTWSLNQTLQSGCFQVFVTQNTQDLVFDEKDLRRYQLLAERCQAHFFLLSEQNHNSWVPHLQLEVTKKNSELTINILRKRGS